MERKDVPQKYSVFDPVKHFPDDGCGAFCDNPTFGWPFQRHAQACSMALDVHIVRQSEACAPAAAIAQVAADPDGVHRRETGPFYHRREPCRPASRRIRPVMHPTTVGVRVEAVLKAQGCDRIDKWVLLHVGLHSGGWYTTVLASRSPTIQPPLASRTLRKTS